VLRANWSAALDSFAQSRDDMLLEAKHDVLRLAVLLAEKIVKRKVEIDDRVAVEQLAEVLGSLAHRTRLRVGVNPLDRSQLELALPALVKRFDADHVELYDDPDITRGSVVVATPTGGQIDAGIDTQLERLVAALLPDDSFRRFGLGAA
jgi:flagellar biosynthesis/type III secretory pathway protein FliH